MAGRPVQLRVGGQTYRVVTSASDEELRRLAAVVDQKLETVVATGRAVTPQAMLLAAMALAHDLEQEKSRSAAFADRARGAFGRMLARVDAALGEGALHESPAAGHAEPPAATLPLASLRPANEP